MGRTISELRAIELFKAKCSDMDMSDLGFILTVIRDNAKHEDVHEFLTETVNVLWEKTR